MKVLDGTGRIVVVLVIVAEVAVGIAEIQVAVGIAEMVVAGIALEVPHLLRVP